MMSTETGSSRQRDRIESSRRRAVRVAGFLLATQGLAALAVAFRLGLWRDWTALAEETLSTAQIPSALSTAGPIAILATLMFVAALGFLWVKRGAWLLAMSLQALMLGVGLSSHLRDGPTLAYLPMAYSVFMVFYMNSRPVRSTLHGSSKEQPRRG